MAEAQTIYVELLDEGTTCWRPVKAERVDGDAYRIVGDKPSDETWPFSGDSKLAAYERQRP
jgi:hypothetical protein